MTTPPTDRGPQLVGGRVNPTTRSGVQPSFRPTARVAHPVIADRPRAYGRGTSPRIPGVGVIAPVGLPEARPDRLGAASWLPRGSPWAATVGAAAPEAAAGTVRPTGAPTDGREHRNRRAPPGARYATGRRRVASGCHRMPGAPPGATERRSHQAPPAATRCPGGCRRPPPGRPNSRRHRRAPGWVPQGRRVASGAAGRRVPGLPPRARCRRAAGARGGRRGPLGGRRRCRRAPRGAAVRIGTPGGPAMEAGAGAGGMHPR